MEAEDLDTEQNRDDDEWQGYGPDDGSDEDWEDDQDG